MLFSGLMHIKSQLLWKLTYEPNPNNFIEKNGDIIYNYMRGNTYES